MTRPRLGRVDLLVFDGGQGVGGFFVFFLGGMERKDAGGIRIPAGRVECLGVFVCFTWDFVFLVIFFHVVA